MDQQNLETPVSVGDWMITLLLTAIPIVGLIMLLVWAFGGGGSVSKSNWAKAVLLWAVIGVAFWILIFIIVGGGVITALRS